MTLTTAALNVLSVSQSGSLETAESSLRQLDEVIKAGVEEGEIASVMSILREARSAMYAHRATITESLQKLENSSLYSHPSQPLFTSWELAG